MKKIFDNKQKKATLKKEGKDGKAHIVFSEVSLNQHTLKIHPGT